MQTLDTELRKVEKAESAVLWLAAAVSILSALYLVYAISATIADYRGAQAQPVNRAADTAQL